MRYIGSKTKLLPFIENAIAMTTDTKRFENMVFCDMFAGTGSVGRHFRKLGTKVIANDLQTYSEVINKAYLSPKPKNVDLDYYNDLQGVEGFIFQNYCREGGNERNYFSCDNAKRIDAVRLELNKIEKEKPVEFNYILACLINAADVVANTAGHYAGYFKKSEYRHGKRLVLEHIDDVEGAAGKVYKENANKLIDVVKGNVLYLDPPYNQRQYNSNYHLLETIAKYDNPEIRGITGKRNDSELKSEYCSKRTALKALDHLIERADFEYIFLSYNDEGIIPMNQIKNTFGKYGEYSCYETNYRRYKSKNKESGETKVGTIEYLHCLKKF